MQGRGRAMVHYVRTPMRVAFGHARATRDVAESVILRLWWDGVEGIGECVPRDYVTGETPTTVFDAIAAFPIDTVLAAIRTSHLEEAVEDIRRLDLPTRLAQHGHLGLAAACCVELALLDACCRRLNVPLRAACDAYRLPAGLTRKANETQRFSRALDTSKAPERLFDPPRVFAVAKIKVGLGAEVDVERVRTVRELGGPELVICVDANMAWSLDEACRMAKQLEPYAVAWYEEPLAKGALLDYRRLRERTGVRVMLDESLCSLRDAEAALAEAACDLFNIRLSKNGGFISGLALAELAHRHGIQIQMGTHPGSHAVLRAAEWSFAQSVGTLVAVEAVRSNIWFDEELANELLAIDLERVRMVPLDGPGLGVTLRPELLERFTVRRAHL